MSQLTAMMNELDTAMINQAISEMKIEDIITKHAKAAAATALGAGIATFIFPVASAVVDVLVSTGIIWSMYSRISRELGIPMSKNLLKTLGSAFLSNIVANLGGALLLELTVSCVPAVGVAASAAICYGITYLAGCLFIKLLVNVFKAGKRPEMMTEAELKELGKKTSAEVNCKKIFKDAQNEAKERIKKGEITKADQIDE